jgi:hypothetical protein
MNPNPIKTASGGYADGLIEIVLRLITIWLLQYGQ